MKLPANPRVLWLLLFMVLMTACGRSSNEEFSETEATIKNLRFGTFNMLRLGHGEKDDERLAKLIIKSKFHIFSGVEIMRSDAAFELRDTLRKLTGKKWELSLSKTASGETSYKEFLGFYYRSDLIKPVSSAEGFCATSKAVDQTENGCFVVDKGTDGVPSFDRDPYVAQFTIKDRKFALGAVHLVWGGSDSESVQRRQGELRDLKKTISSMGAVDGYNVMILGDFNLSIAKEMAGAGEVSAQGSSPKMPAEFFSAAPAVTGLITGPTTVGLSNYDHILYLNKNEVKHVPGSPEIITDFDIGDADEKALFKKDVSDHFPSGATFSL